MPIAMIPRDHISAFGPYSVRVTTSGAIQYGLPTIVFRFVCASPVVSVQRPKSTIVGNVTFIRDFITRVNTVHTEFNVTCNTQ
jgi:hypothetical protein